MSDQTERERLLKLASDIDCDSTKLVSLDVAEMNAVVAALRFQAAALDGGAVSQDVRKRVYEALNTGLSHDMTTDEIVTDIISALRTPQQDEARDLRLIKFIAKKNYWHCRNEVAAEQLAAFLAAEKEPK